MWTKWNCTCLRLHCNWEETRTYPMNQQGTDWEAYFSHRRIKQLWEWRLSASAPSQGQKPPRNRSFCLELLLNNLSSTQHQACPPLLSSSIHLLAPDSPHRLQAISYLGTAGRKRFSFFSFFAFLELAQPAGVFIKTESVEGQWWWMGPQLKCVLCRVCPGMCQTHCISISKRDFFFFKKKES